MEVERQARAPSGDHLPESDVSAWVGVTGLAALFAWIVLCRNWPAVADFFHFPGPRERLAGPYAALCSMLFVGAAMAAQADVTR